jgi:MFS family permease
VTALLLGGIHRGERGVYLGMQQTLGGIGRVVIPLWAGFAYDHLGHRVPFWTSAALVGGVLVLGLGIEELRTRELGLAIPDGESAAAAGVDNAGVKIGVSGRATLNGGHTLCYASCNALPDISA